MGLLTPHPPLKDGKQKLYFISNYIHIVNKRLNRRFKVPLVTPHDISLALIKVLSSPKYAYHHISFRNRLKYPDGYGKWNSCYQSSKIESTGISNLYKKEGGKEVD
jgi:hypothetical protein